MPLCCRNVGEAQIALDHARAGAAGLTGLQRHGGQGVLLLGWKQTGQTAAELLVGAAAKTRPGGAGPEGDVAVMPLLDQCVGRIGEEIEQEVKCQGVLGHRARANARTPGEHNGSRTLVGWWKGKRPPTGGRSKGMPRP